MNDIAEAIKSLETLEKDKKDNQDRLNAALKAQREANQSKSDAEALLIKVEAAKVEANESLAQFHNEIEQKQDEFKNRENALNIKLADLERKKIEQQKDSAFTKGELDQQSIGLSKRETACKELESTLSLKRQAYEEISAIIAKFK